MKDQKLKEVNGSVRTITKIVSEYDQEKPQLHTEEKPMAPRGRVTQQPRDTKKTN